MFHRSASRDFWSNVFLNYPQLMPHMAIYIYWELPRIWLIKTNFVSLITFSAVCWSASYWKKSSTETHSIPESLSIEHWGIICGWWLVKEWRARLTAIFTTGIYDGWIASGCGEDTTVRYTRVPDIWYCTTKSGDYFQNDMGSMFQLWISTQRDYSIIWTYLGVLFSHQIYNVTYYVTNMSRTLKAFVTPNLFCRCRSEILANYFVCHIVNLSFTTCADPPKANSSY